MQKTMVLLRNHVIHMWGMSVNIAPRTRLASDIMQLRISILVVTMARTCFDTLDLFHQFCCISW